MSTAPSTFAIRGIELASDPAREPCFQVVHLHTDLMDLAGMDAPARRQRLHRHMHNEMQNLEIAAQTLADFPDAPWEVRLQIARQCWDESRHAALVHRRLLAHGGRKGEFPVMNYEWGVVCRMDSLAARLALQNRSFEAGEMDLLRHLQREWIAAGDGETAAVYDAILADEVNHVRYANRWLQRECRERPRTAFEVAKAVMFLQRVTAAMAPQPGDKNAAGVDLGGWTHLDVMCNVADRRLAEFSDAEIHEVLRREGLGSLAPKEP
jgi:uncharacterized ferritin-like protein (DUF455 family)